MKHNKKISAKSARKGDALGFEVKRLDALTERKLEQLEFGAEEVM